jgi:LmbE family N-acetylglucosaminyl deacetylase
VVRVAAIVAHPDDEILGVGGTLLRHKDAGDKVNVVVAYECRPESTQASFEAEHRLGIPYHRLPMFEHEPLVVSTVEEEVMTWRPDIVYTHSLADLHHEHRELHERVMVACRPQSGVKVIYAFETPSATDWGLRPFVPQRFVDVTLQMHRKLNAMEAYASELRDELHPRNLDSLATRAQYWGQRVGRGYAEAFEVIRECW